MQGQFEGAQTPRKLAFAALESGLAPGGPIGQSELSTIDDSPWESGSVPMTGAAQV